MKADSLRRGRELLALFCLDGTFYLQLEVSAIRVATQ